MLNFACGPRADLPHQKASITESCQLPAESPHERQPKDRHFRAAVSDTNPLRVATVHQLGQALLRAAHTFIFLQGRTLRQKRPRGLSPGVRSSVPLATGPHKAGFNPLGLKSPASRRTLPELKPNSKPAAVPYRSDPPVSHSHLPSKFTGDPKHTLQPFPPIGLPEGLALLETEPKWDSPALGTPHTVFTEHRAHFSMSLQPVGRKLLLHVCFRQTACSRAHSRCIISF